DLEARIHADHELRRPDPRLDRAELNTLDHSGNRPELAGRKDLGLDPATGPLLETGAEALAPFVLHVVQRGRGALERNGLRLGRGRREGDTGEDRETEKEGAHRHGRLLFPG